MNGFVGVSQDPLSADSLIQLLEKLSIQINQPSYYFLRWAHTVSGFWQRRPDSFSDLKKDIADYLTTHQIKAIFPSPEGQMFNSQLELRWKQKGSNYAVLLLSTSDGPQSNDHAFQAIEEQVEWQIEEYPAYLYGSDETATETRFPHKFHHQNLKVSQRYFKDATTATVHFVALTVGK